MVPNPTLIELGAAVTIIYLCLQGTRLVLEFAGKMPKRIGENNGQVGYRLDMLDKQIAERVTRIEYESRNSDILRQLARIESKLDNIWGVRNLNLPSG